MTVTDADAATDNAYPNAFNTEHHTTDAATTPDDTIITAENKMSVRQLLDGQ